MTYIAGCENAITRYSCQKCPIHETCQHPSNSYDRFELIMRWFIVALVVFIGFLIFNRSLIFDYIGRFL